VFSFVVLHSGILNHLQEHNDLQSCFPYSAISSGFEDPINKNDRHINIIQEWRRNATLQKANLSSSKLFMQAPA
jgi:hypothetical protein